MGKVKITAALISGIFVFLHLSSCNKDEGFLNGSTSNINQGSNGQQDDWLVPINEVVDGGPGRDGIPALIDPEKISVSSATYLTDTELILGYFDGENAVAYPHQILDWHEIINDKLSSSKLNSLQFAITYCPLTGTGIGWERTINGKVTTFGVSGLIYNNNLIPYDRETGSNWSQMKLDCVNGDLISTKIKTFQLVETQWKTWKEMYPFSKVASLNTGFDRSYGDYPYGDYKTAGDFFLFPLSRFDERLHAKERVHGIIINEEAKIYRFGSFPTKNTLINDVVDGKEVIIVGNAVKNFIVSFYSELEDGTKPIFTTVSKNNVILEDNLGNNWDIFGYAVSGPSQGMRLKRTESFMGYWFAWGAFYPDSEIYD